MSASVTERILRDLREILRARPAPGHAAADAETVEGLRQLVHIPIVQEAIERGSDAAPGFVLRAFRTILANTAASPTAAVARLRELQPEMDRVLRTGRNTRTGAAPRKPPSR
jgi:hypothetical protein